MTVSLAPRMQLPAEQAGAASALETTAELIANLVSLDGKDAAVDRLVAAIADDRVRLLRSLLDGRPPPRRPSISPPPPARARR